MKYLSYSISYPIRKSREEVFRAIVDPAILTTYFPKTASGFFEEGAILLWTWDHESAEFSVDRVIPSERIEGHWQAYGVNYEVTTIFEFTAREDGVTVVTISEHGFHDDDKGHVASYAQCSGWTDFLLCLRARLEHNIDLRQF